MKLSGLKIYSSPALTSHEWCFWHQYKKGYLTADMWLICTGPLVSVAWRHCSLCYTHLICLYSDSYKVVSWWRQWYLMDFSLTVVYIYAFLSLLLSVGIFFWVLSQLDFIDLKLRPRSFARIAQWCHQPDITVKTVTSAAVALSGYGITLEGYFDGKWMNYVNKHFTDVLSGENLATFIMLSKMLIT